MTPELRKLLQPFVNAAECFDERDPDHADIWESGGAMEITVGDLRRLAVFLASADTHPKGGDVEQAPLVSGAVPKADAQTPPPSERGSGD